MIVVHTSLILGPHNWMLHTLVGMDRLWLLLLWLWKTLELILHLNGRLSLGHGLHAHVRMYGHFVLAELLLNLLDLLQI